MKAIVWTNYGPPDVLQLQEVEKPIPKDNEVLIRIRATTVTAGDMELRALKVPILIWLPARLFLGLFRPRRIKILGQELAGEIEAVGKDVTRYSVGDRVLAGTGFELGAYAEYKCLRENGVIVLKPAGTSYEEVVALALAGLEALRLVRRANIQPGQKVLISAAGGSIGTFAIQLAKHFGAEVTGIDSTVKLEMMRSIGADRVIDYTQEDFRQSGETYHAIIDVAGKTTLAQSSRALKQDGTYVSDHLGLLPRGKQKKVVGLPRREGLAILTKLLVDGKIKAVIDRSYPLEQMAEAHRYVETGVKKGNVIITVG